MFTPLAERMRPQSLKDFFGQEHLLGEQGVLFKLLKSNILPSIILWGPSGSGKTTLAQLIAKESNRDFYAVSAVEAGVKEVREVIDRAKNKNLFNHQNAPVLFIDEIHRFNKGQQDALLNAIEKGYIVLIGATTENPSFEIVKALLSRCQVYVLEKLNKPTLHKLLHHAIVNDEILNKKIIVIEQEDAFLQWADGDARKLLNALEVICNQGEEKIFINQETLEKSLQEKLAIYDKNGEMHYDIISAFIKSIRGSDPHAAVYWLARMIEGGEDPRFIARRLVIAAAEDIGLANPTALVIANNTYQTVSYIGMPEARIILSECTVYLATSPKSNSTYLAIKHAQQIVKETGNLSVPLHLRNAPTQFMKDRDYGKDYKYAHDYTMHFIDEEFLPEGLKGKIIYEPAKNSKEAAIKDFLEKRWQKKYKKE